MSTNEIEEPIAPEQEPPTEEPPTEEPPVAEPGEPAPVQEPPAEEAQADTAEPILPDDTMAGVAASFGEPVSAPVEADEVPTEPEAADAPVGDLLTQPRVEEENDLLAVLEAIIYVTEEPLSLQQIALALRQPAERVERALARLVLEYEQSHRGLTVREIAGGYKMGTKAEHHESVRAFVRNLKPPLKLSLAALETLAVIAYKQPITAPEIQDIRGVQGGGVLKTLLDRKLITTAGRKNVIGKPILYKTTREFLIQFGLKDLSELPTLKEFEELRRLALTDDEPEETEAAVETPTEETVGEPS